MPANHPNSGSQRDNDGGLNFSIQYYAIIVFLINTSCTLLQVKYQSKDVTPFETHYRVMLAFFVTLHLHAIVLVAQIKLQAYESSYHEIFGKISLFTGALASILPMIILIPYVGWFILVLWGICFIKFAHHSYQEFLKLLYLATVEILDLLKRLMNHSSLEQQTQLPV